MTLGIYLNVDEGVDDEDAEVFFLLHQKGTLISQFLKLIFKSN